VAFGPNKTTPTHIYVHYFTAANTTRVRRFVLSTNLWETADIGAGDVTTSAVNTFNVRIAVRSDGDIIAAYTHSVNGISYRVWEGVSWAGSVAIAAGAGNWLVDVVVGPSDRSFFTYVDNTANDHTYRTLDSANTLGTATDADASAHTTAKLRGNGSISWNNGTSDYIAFPTRDTGGEFDLYYGIAGATLGSAAILNAVSTSTTPNTTSADMAFVGTGSAGRVQVVWSTANAILRDVSTTALPSVFGADTTVLSGLTDADPAPQVIQGGGAWGILYQDGGAVKVEWIVAPAAGGLDITSDAAVIDVAGADATFAGALTATADAAVITVAGADGTLNEVNTLAAGNAALVDVAGAAATLTGGLTATSTAALIDTAGVNATLAGGFTASSTAALIDAAGVDATLTGGFTASADAAVINVAGVDATFAGALTATSDASLINVAGVDAALTGGLTATADAAVINLAGHDATFEEAGGGPTSLNLTAGNAALIDVAGVNAAFTGGLTATGDFALIDVAGADATLSSGFSATADAAVIDLAGAGATLTIGLSATADAGLVDVAGVNATLTGGMTMTADAALISISGAPATWGIGRSRSSAIIIG
jgi:hypothetical protein